MWRPALTPARISLATRPGVTHVAGDADTFFRGILFLPPFVLPSSFSFFGPSLFSWLGDSRPVSHDHMPPALRLQATSWQVQESGLETVECVLEGDSVAVFGSLARHGEGRRSACSVGGKQEDWSPLRPGGDASCPLHSLLSMSTVCGA